MHKQMQRRQVELQELKGVRETSWPNSSGWWASRLEDSTKDPTDGRARMRGGVQRVRRRVLTDPQGSRLWLDD